MRLPPLILGLFLFSVGVVMSLYSNLGMSPWGVFQVGLAEILPLTLGQVSQVVGLAVLVLGWALGFPPGLGTVANVYLVGLFIDLVMVWNLLPQPVGLVPQMAMLILGIVVIGVASLLYLKVQLGAGPRDGLMVGLVTKLDRPVSQVRMAIEVTVLVMGFFLGGPVGIGTILNALLTGPVVQLSFKLGGFNPKSEQVDLYRLARLLSGRSKGLEK
ncbi:membrane protein [Candidatus Bathyarchaeota archaeon]|nr:membrane protein [Candidatus Bathyarchaeota archaeon]